MRIGIGQLRTLAACGALALAGAASAQPYAFHEIARTGLPAPGGGKYGDILHFGANGAGDIAFSAAVSEGSEITWRLFVYEDGAIRAEARAGDPSPLGSGLFYQSFGGAHSNRAGEIAFEAFVGDGVSGAFAGLFVRSASGDRAVALAGDAVPVPGGGTIEYFGGTVWIDEAGRVLFSAQVTTPGGQRSGWFLEDGGAIALIALEGTTAPGTGGGTFETLDPSDVQLVDGVTTLGAFEIANGDAGSGIFRHAAGTLAPLVLEGDPVTAPRGGTFGRVWAVSANADGDAAFRGGVFRDGLTVPLEGVFVLRGSGLDEIIYWDDPMPGTDHGRFRGPFRVRLNAHGDAAISATFADDDGYGRRALIATRGGALHPVAFEADSVHATPDFDFNEFFDHHLVDDGRVFFIASVPGGSGLYVASPATAVPALESGRLILILALAVAPLALMRRRRPARPRCFRRRCGGSGCGGAGRRRHRTGVGGPSRTPPSSLRTT
jgi:hypothetical protein